MIETRRLKNFYPILSFVLSWKIKDNSDMEIISTKSINI